MATQNSSIDENSQATITARLNTNGVDIVRVQVDASTHALSVDDASTGSDNGGTFAATDSNGRPTMFAVSESDGVTLVALYADSSGKLLIDSN